MIRSVLLACLLLVAACSDRGDNGPLHVDVIDAEGRVGGDSARSVLAASTRQGLVALDGEGEIVPALAQRWTVLDDDSFIFRLADHRWNDGTPLTSGQIARRLREARSGGGALAPLLADIAEINAVTPDILELTFSRHRPDLLRLLALPELGVTGDGKEGLGPLAVSGGYSLADQRVILEPRRAPTDPDDEDADPPDPIEPGDTIELRRSRPALAVARFNRGDTALVLGGDWTTLAYALAIRPAGALIVDQTEGLFGLAFVEESGFLANADNRQILSLAINRERIARALGRPEAIARSSLLPAETSGIDSPVAPPWRDVEFGARRQFARTAIASWKAGNGEIEALRIALPDAAGSRLLFALIAADWQAIGIEAIRVGWNEDADLRLLDLVAPSDHVEWYLHFFRCDAPYPCSEAYRNALNLLAEAPSPRVRRIRAGEAALALEGTAPFIPLLRPIRWALVAPSLTGIVANRYASHPLAPLLEARE